MGNTLREISRQNFDNKFGNTSEWINTGSLQRIADAVEKMAQNYDELIQSRNDYKQRCEWNSATINKQEHRIRGLRGAITKMNNNKKARNKK
jgi:hypothetical protein